MTIIKSRKLKGKNKGSNIFEKLMAFWAAVNLGLVFFDLSYIPLRDFWLQGRIQIFIKLGKYELEIPEYPVTILPFSITKYYDWVKGIEPYRDTEAYLKTVENLENNLNQIVISPSNNQETIDKILADLRQQSKTIIETNPFQIANKTGTLERIKNKMRVHIFGSKNASATESFEIFWSKEYLIKKGIRQELNFFEQEIKPLIATNYYRPIGENGQLIDNFQIIDFSFFTIYFFGEFLARSWYISRNNKGVKWFDAMLWRWYDIFLFLPVFRWLRIIPVTIRLNQVGLLNLSAIKRQASQGFVAGIAEDLTEVVVIGVINQTQSLIAEGTIKTVLANQNNREYIDLNNTNEIKEITKLLLELIINQVIPEIRIEVEAILSYVIEKTLTQSDVYQKLQNIPGLANLQHNLTDQLIKQIYQLTTETLQGLLQQDREFDNLLDNLGNKLSKTMGTQIQAQESMEKMQNLLIDFLEEVKVNYIQKLSVEDIEEILAQKRALQN